MRAVAFIDGQNLYHACRKVFGCGYPDFDVTRLASAVCATQGWDLVQIRFYTGIHDPRHNPKWHGFWINKIRAMRAAGVYVYTRPLRYAEAHSPSGTHLVAREKRIDLRLALDAVELCAEGAMDVALFFSQDQDLAEAASALKRLSQRQGKKLVIACAYPQQPPNRSGPGIQGSIWLPFDRATYSACVDATDYFHGGSAAK